MPQGEPLEWKKFFGGFFNAKNTAKSVINLWHTAIVVLLCYGLFLVYGAVVGYFKKSNPPPIDTSTITGQTVNQNIDKSTKEVSQTYMPFSGGLFSFGSHGKTHSEEKK